MKILLRQSENQTKLPVSPACRNIGLTSRRRFLTGLCSTAVLFCFNAMAKPIRVVAKRANQAAFEALQAALEGTVISAKEENYEIYRQGLVWQMLKPGRYPAIIVQASSVSDVSHAVKFARRHSYKVSIRCGGHNYISSFLTDGTLALDVSRLQEIEVDPADRTARVGPGVHGRTLTEALAEHGFAFPVAHPGRIAMGGYLLGGGQGWNSQAWGGAACLNIESVDVVTAEGELVTASREVNSDLYWAARGAGPCFFGVVTSFTIKLHDKPRSILRSTYVWPIEAAAEVSAWAYKKAMEMPDFVETWFFLAAQPGVDKDNEQSSQSEIVCMVQSTAFAGDETAARSALAPLTNIEDELQAKRLDKHEFEKTSLLSLLDETDAYSLPWHYAADNIWTDAPPQALTEKLIGHMATMPSDMSSIIFVIKLHDGPHSSDDLPILGKIYFLCFNVWIDADQTQANIEWRDKIMTLAAPYSKGHYINEADFLATPSRVKNSFHPEAWQKLITTRDKFDPNHLFQTQLDQLSGG